MLLLMLMVVVVVRVVANTSEEKGCEKRACHIFVDKRFSLVNVAFSNVYFDLPRTEMRANHYAVFAYEKIMHWLPLSMRDI